MVLAKKINVYSQGVFYFIAGLNHFLQPTFYYPLIPSYLSFPELINYTSGVLELVLGIGLLFSKTRKTAAYGVILMLVVFIPSHIYFIQSGGCVGELLCLGEWVSWVRLILVHPLLILWAWGVRSITFNHK